MAGNDYRDARGFDALLQAFKLAPNEYGWSREELGDDYRSGVAALAFSLIVDTDKHYLNWGAGSDMQPQEWARLLDMLCAEFRSGLIEGMNNVYGDLLQEGWTEEPQSAI